MAVVTRKDSLYFWMNLERPGLPPLRESTRVLAKGVAPPILAENRALAQKIYNARMGDLARQRHGLVLEHPRATFRAYADWYVDHVTAAKRTAGRERSAITHLVGFFGRYTVDVIDKDLAREYMTARKRLVKASTVNRELDVLKSMLGAAVPKYVAANPLLGLRRLRARSPEAHVLSYDDEAALLEVMAPPDQAVLICGLDALLRLSDIVTLRWTQDRGEYFDIFDPKAEPYRPPISTRLRAALDGLERKGARVFHHLSDQNAAIRMFADACTRAKIPHGRPDGVTFHSLRHTGATRAASVPGMDPRKLMALGGWRDIKSVMRYLHPERPDRALVDLMSMAPHARDVHGRAPNATKTAKKR